jgi:hypothetical protein
MLRGETDPRIAVLDLPARIDASLKQVDRRLRELHQRELERRAELERNLVAFCVFFVDSRPARQTIPNAVLPPARPQRPGGS